ncbi:MAG TPA: STAS domain-containing protein [Thermoanaerobaculia bacterium]|jgi:anti-sigma B factor antagonist|nr:STAS domain-containing protein [Thermoanaerobaculia bacterium]
MHIETADDGRVTVLSAEGDLILGPPETAFKRKIDELLEQGRVQLLVDLSAVRYVDSSGLGALVYALTETQNEGGQTKLLNAGPRIVKLLEITKLNSIFEIYDDREAAVSSF